MDRHFLKRQYNLKNSMQFGREFYDTDIYLSNTNCPIDVACLKSALTNLKQLPSKSYMDYYEIEYIKRRLKRVKK